MRAIRPMCPVRRRVLGGMLLAAGGLAAAAGGPVRELRWEELVPKGWDPNKLLPDLGNGLVVDGSAKALDQMRALRRVWDEAPTNPALEGLTVRLPGYVVPVEETRDGLKEFLLVPYFGACIHTPPPPANQIVHVVSARPVKGFASMATVWVTGTLTQARGDSGMGVTGYRLAATAVSRYTAPGR